MNVELHQSPGLDLKYGIDLNHGGNLMTEKIKVNTLREYIFTRHRHVILITTNSPPIQRQAIGGTLNHALEVIDVPRPTLKVPPPSVLRVKGFPERTQRFKQFALGGGDFPVLDEEIEVHRQSAAV